AGADAVALAVQPTAGRGVLRAFVVGIGAGGDRTAEAGGRVGLRGGAGGARTRAAAFAADTVDAVAGRALGRGSTGRTLGLQRNAGGCGAVIAADAVGGAGARRLARRGVANVEAAGHRRGGQT